MYPGLSIRAAVLEGRLCASMDAMAGIRAVREDARTTWLDVQVHDLEEARHLLEGELGFHPLAIEDALSVHERPALQEYGDTVFLSLPVPHREGGEITFREIGFFLLPKALVTVSAHPQPVLETWFERWMERPERIGDHPIFLLYVILDAIVDGYFPLLDSLEDEMDDLTDVLFSGDTSKLPEIMTLKRTMLHLRRAVSPTRDVVSNLLRRDLSQVPATARPYFQDIYDHILRLGELIETNRETLASILDVHLSTVSNQLNEVVKKMTVLATILMTAALIAGIYGMNFEVMPELKWAFGYPFALFLMFGSGVAIIFVFRRMRWL